MDDQMTLTWALAHLCAAQHLAQLPTMRSLGSEAMRSIWLRLQPEQRTFLILALPAPPQRRITHGCALRGRLSPDIAMTYLMPVQPTRV